MRPSFFTSICLLMFGAMALAPANAQTPPAPAIKPPAVHLIWMGGNDCPPCVAWRQFEKPKLEKSAEFQAIKFSYVVKTITSSVPSSFFLPNEVKPYKDKLDVASSGLGGSPQAALLVNGEVFDYFFGTRTAEQIEQMLVAVRTGTAYPFQACTKLAGRHRCADKS